jgi:DNA-binding transcriptional LysR family regulator
MIYLDLKAVHAFVLVAELKSFTRAARILNSTQSSVSLKVSRLERRIGCRLFDRTPRLVRLSTAGEIFLPRARELVDAHIAASTAFDERPGRLAVGVSHHIVGVDLCSLLGHVRQERDLILDLRIGPTRGLLDSYDAGELDAVLLIRHNESRRSGEAIRMEEFRWMAAPSFQMPPDDRLPLILQDEPCNMRAMAVSAVATAGITWRESFLGTGLASLAAAAQAGFGVAAISRRAAPAGLVDVGKRFGLPELPQKPIVLHSNVSDPRAREVLMSLTAKMRSESPDGVDEGG